MMDSLLFKGEMIRAIQNTRPNVWPVQPIDPSLPFKWQTRRVMKVQPLIVSGFMENGVYTYGNHGDEPDDFITCPYGQPGDRLRVRETWACIGAEHVKPSEIAPGYTVHYAADDVKENWRVEKWRPSIFMPRWASRLCLEVKGIRVEQVQQISDDDTIAEGVAINWPGPGPEPYRRNLPAVYSHLWDKINGKRPGCSWHNNPMVWVIEFMRVE